MSPEAAYRIWLSRLTPLADVLSAARADGIPRWWVVTECDVLRAQHDRCLCGQQDVVCDHDHRTGLIRGWLCRSCNAAEGFGHGGIFAAYRRWPPTAHLGVWLQYINGWTPPDFHGYPQNAPQMWPIALPATTNHEKEAS